MKTNNANRRISFMSLFLVTMMLAGIQGVKAQDMLDDTNDLLQDGGAVQMDDINLDGKLSPSERLRKNRERLEERNKQMVEKKIEDVRIRQEIALTNKLQDAFGKSLNNLNEDKVQVAQAAPVAPQPVVAVVAPPVIETRIVEVPAPVKAQKDSKVIAAFGATAIKGDMIDFESKLNVNISAENHVLPNVSVGVAVGYSTLDITDTANNFVNNVNQTYYNPGYTSTFGNTGRAITYDRFNVEANGKFFLTVESKVKPFVGAALGYSRSSMKYTDSGNNYSYTYGTNNGVYGNEALSSGYVSGAAKLGAEVDFSETVGMNLDLSYTKAISSGIASKAGVTNTNPDQIRLANITNAMEKADVTAIQVGLVVRF
jgi:outer membrane protein W